MTGTTSSSTVVAEPPGGSGTDGMRSDGVRYLTFMLLDEMYALDILDVTEIIEFRSLTVVPMMPPAIRGVLNLRGRVMPVVDLAARFGQGRTPVGRRTGVVVVETPSNGDEPGIAFGVMVDAVNKVVDLATSDVQDTPAFGAGIRSQFISGMARIDGDFVIVLDLRELLSDLASGLEAIAESGGDALTGVTTGITTSTGS